MKVTSGQRRRTGRGQEKVTVVFSLTSSTARTQEQVQEHLLSLLFHDRVQKERRLPSQTVAVRTVTRVTGRRCGSEDSAPHN